MCPPRSGLAVGRVGTSGMQRLEHSDKPEKEAPAGNVAAHGQPVLLPQGEARAVPRAGLCIWAVLLQLLVHGQGMHPGSSRQGEQAGQTYRGINPMDFPQRERFPGVPECDTSSLSPARPKHSKGPGLASQREMVRKPSEHPKLVGGFSFTACQQLWDPEGWEGCRGCCGCPALPCCATTQE